MYRKVTDGLTEREVEGELVLLQSDTGNVHQLNHVAACVWRHLEEDAGIEALIDHVTGQFAIDRETAQSDINKLLDDLAALGLIEVDETPQGNHGKTGI
jgi:hypothetical protein